LARIQCPRCGHGETIDLYRRYLVECHQCNLKFTVVIVGNKQAQARTASCPQCGHSEPVSIRESSAVRIKCDQCGHQFTFEGGQTT